MLHAGHVPDAVVGARAVPDLPDHLVRLRRRRDRRAALRAQAVRQHLHPHRQPDHGRARGADRLARERHRRRGGGERHGRAVRGLMTLLSPGDEIVASSHLYGGTVTQLTHTFRKLSVERAVRGPDAARAAGSRPSRPGPGRSYGETIGNPRGSILDLEPLAALADAHRIPLIVDNTFATPYLCRPMDWGATIVLHSATKFIGGHGNSIGGAVLESGRFDYSHVPDHRRSVALVPRAPVLRHLRPLRLPDEGARGDACATPAPACRRPTRSCCCRGWRRCRSGWSVTSRTRIGVARFLRDHPRVAWVAYAGLEDHPEHALARKYLGGRPGAVFSFGLADDRRRRPRRGPAVHRRAAALLPPRQRRRRAQPGHSPRLDHPPAAERGGAGARRGGAGADPAVAWGSKPWRICCGTWIRPCMRPSPEHDAHRGRAAAVSGSRGHPPADRERPHGRDRGHVGRPAEGERLRRELSPARGLSDHAGQPARRTGPGRDDLSRPGQHSRSRWTSWTCSGHRPRRRASPARRWRSAPRRSGCSCGS